MGVIYFTEVKNATKEFTFHMNNIDKKIILFLSNYFYFVFMASNFS